MGMNRAISLGFLFLLTVSFVSDGLGQAQPNGRNSRDAKKSQLDEYLRNLPDNYHYLPDLYESHYRGPVGSTHTFVLPAKGRNLWVKNSESSGSTIFFSGHPDVDNLQSFNVTIGQLGSETISLTQEKMQMTPRGSYRFVIVGRRTITVEGVTATQATADAERRQQLKTLPTLHHYLPANGDYNFDLSVGVSQFFVVENIETSVDGAPTGLTVTVEGPTGLEITKKLYWNTEEYGIPKLYSFEVKPTKTGTFTFDVNQMKGSQTMGAKYVFISVV